MQQILKATSVMGKKIMFLSLISAEDFKLSVSAMLIKYAIRKNKEKLKKSADQLTRAWIRL